MQLTKRNHYTPCFWAALWNETYYRSFLAGTVKGESVRDQRVHALSVKSGRLLETTVENVHFDKNLGMAEITRESAEDLGQRSYHASERWWGRQESKRREQWPEHSVMKSRPVAIAARRRSLSRRYSRRIQAEWVDSAVKAEPSLLPPVASGAARLAHRNVGQAKVLSPARLTVEHRSFPNSSSSLQLSRCEDGQLVPIIRSAVPQLDRQRLHGVLGPLQLQARPAPG